MTAVLETCGLGQTIRSPLRVARLRAVDTRGQSRRAGRTQRRGQTTLLQLAAGLLRPTEGSIEVLGGRPGDGAAQLDRVGFVAQDTPAYSRLSVANHLRMGEWLNTHWDGELLTLAIAKRQHPRPRRRRNCCTFTARPIPIGTAIGQRIRRPHAVPAFGP
jgi:ABC-2 type transport system ATP-binding protein